MKLKLLYTLCTIAGAMSAQDFNGVSGMLVTMVTNADGKTQHVEIRNQSERAIVAFVLKRNTVGGISPNLIFANDGIRPGAVYRPLVTTVHWVSANGTREGSLLNYDVTAVMYANGEMEGEPHAMRHLSMAFKSEHDPIINRLRGSIGKTEAPSSVKTSRSEKPSYLLTPSQDGTAVFGYNSDLSEWNGIVPEGTESPLVNSRAYCFNDSVVPYGYLIGGGAYQFNDGGCGLLYTLESSQLNYGFYSKAPFQTQQNVASQAVLDPVEPALYQAYEQCDLYSNYYPGSNGDPVYGTLGDPWIQIQHGGTCAGTQGGTLNNPN